MRVRRAIPGALSPWWWSCVVLALVASAVSCGGGGTKRYEEHGLSFEYPADWRLTDLESAGEPATNALWETEGIALSADDVVALSAFTLNIDIPGGGPEYARIEAALTQELLAATLGDSDARPTPPRSIRVAGSPAITFEVPTESIHGRPVVSRIVAIFRFDTEYFINCQSTEPNRERVNEACDLLLDTLTISQ